MAEKLKPLQVQTILQTKGIKIFSTLDFTRIFNKNKEASRQFIQDNLGQMFIRLKRGLFTLKNNQPSPELIANKLYSPSYISLETALSNYGIIPEVVYSITSVTTKSTREFSAVDINFSYRTIRKPAFTGYGLQVRSGEKTLMAEPEKALVDYLYFAVLKKISFNDRLDISKLSKTKVLSYAKLFNHKKLIKLIDLIWQSWDKQNHQLNNLDKLILWLKTKPSNI